MRPPTARLRSSSQRPSDNSPFPPSCSNLLANSFNCDCRLAWLGDWLRSRKIVTGNPRCQRPGFLKEIPLQDVALPDFRCEDGRCPLPGILYN